MAERRISRLKKKQVEIVEYTCQTLPDGTGMRTITMSDGKQSVWYKNPGANTWHQKNNN
jgi:hypothetical protein